MSQKLNKGFLIAFGVLVTLTFSYCSKNPDTSTSTIDPQLTAASTNVTATEDPAFVPNELIVKFKPGKTDKEKENVLARVNGKVLEKIHTKAMEKDGDTEGIVLINTSLDALDAKVKINGPEIEYAEPNYIYTHEAIANDPYFTNNSLWGMSSTFGSQASIAWGKGNTGSSSVVVGVIDEGIQYDHPDLDGQIWTNPNEIDGDGIDNDHDGYIDDIHGWDFANNNNSIYDGGTTGSQDSHGTHVSGTIGAKANNTIGVVGMNWHISIISAKFLTPTGGTTANAIKAIDYFVTLKGLGLNIVALNNSWGGGGYSQALYDAISRANKADILFIAAAGNGNNAGIGINIDKKPSYPASYNISNVIAVAAIDVTGKLATWSNYGAKTVHLGAPGVGIWSTVPGTLQYASYSGTSMATPHVTGAVALYASIHPGTAAQIKAAILGSVTKYTALSGKTVSGGRLNVSGF
jgi:subtilisin family serine protease